MTYAPTRLPDRPRNRLLAALPGNQEAEDQFARVIAGATSPVEFCDPANVGRILAKLNALGLAFEDEE